MTTKIKRWAVALTGSLLLIGLPAQANHFTFKRLVVDGQEHATVYSHRMDLFELTTSAGGYTPVQRAQVIIERLEKLAHAHDFGAVRFSVGFRNGEVILQQQDAADHPPHLIITIDRRLAQRAGVNVERLASWYLALLWDHLRLANGQKPQHTDGTPVGTSFQKIYTRLKVTEGHVESEEIERVVAALLKDEEEAFSKAAGRVPASFRPDRLQGEQASSDRLPHTDETDTHPSDSPPSPTRSSQRKPPSEPDDDHDPVGEPKSETPGETRVDGSKPLTKTVGRFHVTVRPAPAAIRVGEKTEFQAEIAETANKEKHLPNATVRVRLIRSEGKPAPSVTASFDAQTETYRFGLTFDRAGDYGISLGVLTEEGEAFTAEFTFSVRSPQKWDFSGSTQRSGNYRVRLAMLPPRAVAGQQIEFAVKVTEAKSAETTNGLETPVTGATVRCWFAEDEQDYAEVAWNPARAAEEPGVYRWRFVLPKAGKYRIVARVAATDEKRFNVEFPVVVTEEAAGEATKK